MNDHQSTFQIYVDSQLDQIAFSYRGPFHESLTERIVDISENTLVDQMGLRKINRKVSFLLVECFQNIIKHGEKLKIKEQLIRDEGMFSFRNAGVSYMINSVNLVKADEVEDLKAQVDTINSKTREELKEMYKKQLQENELSDKGGAGLGLIEIARKSGNKLEYKIEPNDNPELFNFHQQVFFSKSEEPAQNRIEETKTLYDNLISNDLLMSYKGDFSQKSILPLLDIVESNIGTTPEEIAMAKKVGHVLIEILQNISRHAVSLDGERDGVFIIGKRNNHFFVQSGNLVNETNQAELIERIEFINAQSEESLNQLHKEKIKSSVHLEDKSKSGLGLIQIAKAGISPISYNFQPLNGYSFFTLEITV